MIWLKTPTLVARNTAGIIPPLVKKNPQTQLDISQISPKNIMLKRSLETVVISLPVLSTYPPSTLFILPTACLSILVCIVMCLLSLILQSKWYASLFCLRLLTSTCHALTGILCCDLGGNSCMNSATQSRGKTGPDGCDQGDWTCEMKAEGMIKKSWGGHEEEEEKEVSLY